MTQKSQKEFFGIIIPANLLNNSEITLSEKFVYAYISSFKKYCCESNERISEKLGISQKTISRSISNLQKLGYIFIDCEKSNNFGRKLYAVYENPKKLEYLSKRNAILNMDKMSMWKTHLSMDKMSKSLDKMSMLLIE